ncbi:MAG TPA: hypothetical protein VF928_07220 [Usitatibacteraceae bacterium]
MADTRAQKKGEVWVLKNDLPNRYGLAFSSKRVLLAWDGRFEFDAVSSDDAIIGNISTSSARTAGNKLATAKIQKIKCDTLYLLHAKGAKKRLLIFTELDMLRHFEKEVKNGRFPKSIKLLHVCLPDSPQREIEIARKVASDETSPNRRVR